MKRGMTAMGLALLIAALAGCGSSGGGGSSSTPASSSSSSGGTAYCIGTFTITANGQPQLNETAAKSSTSTTGCDPEMHATDLSALGGAGMSILVAFGWDSSLSPPSFDHLMQIITTGDALSTYPTAPTGPGAVFTWAHDVNNTVYHCASITGSSGSVTLTAVPAVGGQVTGSLNLTIGGNDPTYCPSSAPTGVPASGSFSAYRLG